jgi:hypothetical protein
MGPDTSLFHGSLTASFTSWTSTNKFGVGTPSIKFGCKQDIYTNERRAFCRPDVAAG